MRRHTILLTVLINAGLLLVLFATAIRPGESREKTASCAPEAPPPLVYEPPARPVREVPPPPVFETPVVVEKPAIAARIPEESKPAVEKVEASKCVEVTVKKGDSLDKIARGNGTTIDALMKANALKTTRLQIGQILKVPLPEKVETREAIRTADQGSEDAYYVVRSGDNPWLIAMKHRIPLEELLKINHLNEDSARKLKPGDKVRIR